MMSQSMQAFCEAIQKRPAEPEEPGHCAHNPDLMVRAVVKPGEMHHHVLDTGEVQSAFAEMRDGQDGARELSDADLEDVQGEMIRERIIQPFLTTSRQVIGIRPGTS